MAKARPIPGLQADDAFGVAAAKVIAVRAGELAEHSAGVLDMTEIERVHDLRVATRRLRAALEVFRPCFPKPEFKGALREVKALADALGERRDRDVTIPALDQLGAEMAAADRVGVASLVDRLRGEQAEANRALEPYVAERALAGLGERLAELARAAETGDLG